MTLVDTSVWVNHFRRGDDELRTLLEAGEVFCHPLIIGELACGLITKRAEVLELLQALPQSITAEHDEVMHFLHNRQLFGRGLGWIDVHLLASAALSRVKLWTIDRPLKRMAEELWSEEA